MSVDKRALFGPRLQSSRIARAFWRLASIWPSEELGCHFSIEAAATLASTFLLLVLLLEEIDIKRWEPILELQGLQCRVTEACESLTD